MDEAKQAALEKAGWRVCDTQDFLGLTDEEMQLIDLRITLAKEIREKRKERGLSQEQLAAKLHTKQPRIAKIEMASPGVSLDLIARAYFAVGGESGDVGAAIRGVADEANQAWKAKKTRQLEKATTVKKAKLAKLTEKTHNAKTMKTPEGAGVSEAAQKRVPKAARKKPSPLT